MYIQNVIQNLLIVSVILILIATMILLYIAINTSVIYLIYSYILYYTIFISNLHSSPPDQYLTGIRLG